ncbi:hypothetical protein BH23THE1_BH23THE1_15700 [soil metagenome]
MVIDSEIPDTQRVLILQGGGALGAYEVGAFKALSEELPKLDAKKVNPLDLCLILSQEPPYEP